MLRSMDRLLHYGVSTADGETCTLVDVFFDEASWILRYLVVETGSRLYGRKVLLSPAVVQTVRDDEETLGLSVSDAEVRECPETSTELPISREAELLLAKYWSWAPRDTQGPLPPEASNNIQWEGTVEGKESAEEATESDLRSFKEVKGYAIQATDGELGHLQDLLCANDWSIRHAVVDTRNWLPGKQVLLPIRAIGQIRWSDTSLHVESSRGGVKTAPAYDPHEPLSPADEEAVRNHFAQP